MSKILKKTGRARRDDESGDRQDGESGDRRDSASGGDVEPGVRRDGESSRRRDGTSGDELRADLAITAPAEKGPGAPADSIRTKPVSNAGPRPKAARKEPGGEPQPASPLVIYREKRFQDRTPEPFGSDAAGAAESAPAVSSRRMFVIQKHAARRLHYDFRLEWRGALHSWAVPNGLPMKPGKKRLAVEVEDHPIEYADFEGIIPEGNYGAGAAIVWDRGHWTAREGPGEGIDAGKLHFRLEGHKLHGTWILVRTKDDPRSWILFRKLESGDPPDGGQPPGEESVLSGLTVEELRAARDRAGEFRAEIERTGSPRAPVDPTRIDLMLAQTAERPFSAPGWIFEIKYDGYRAIGARSPDRGPYLRSRGGEDMTLIFPEIARALSALPFDDLVLDGELVVLDANGRPDFHALQGRARPRTRIDVERAARENPVTYFVFDLLSAEGFDLRNQPLLARKSLLRGIAPPSGLIRYCDHVEEMGAEMFGMIREMGLEGVIAKKADGKYEPRRSRSWLKFVTERTGDFLVAGYTVERRSPGAAADGVSALHLATSDGSGGWLYAGRVGSGFTEVQRSEMLSHLQPLTRPKPVCTIRTGGATPAGKKSLWCDPACVVEVRYRSFTPDGALRAPVYVRLREDKRPEECEISPLYREVLPPALGDEGGTGRVGSGGGSAGTARPAAFHAREPGAPAPAGRSIKPDFRHLDKVFWPDDGLTKGDLIEYYRSVSEWMLPYLEDRPVVLTRYPDGIGGKSFYQKDAPEHAAGLVRTVKISSHHAGRDIAYFVCDDVDSLLYLANLGSIPIHVWPSRVSAIENPDWCIVDLDPKEAPFRHVVQLALALRGLCDEIGLPSWVKTSGSTGLHVLLPLPPEATFEQSRLLAQLLAAILEGRHPDISTTARHIPSRKGRVYLDALQNRRGQLLVAPYSVRPLPGAPVSAPLDWREVEGLPGPRAFTIRNMRERLLRRRQDPMRELLTTRIDLSAALERLEGILPRRWE